MVLLTQEQIKEIIPHRDPFLFIHEVNALEPGKRCIARTYINEEDYWFQGHFPTYPVTPGVLILEMMAQTGAICAGSVPEFQGKTAFFSKADKVRFRRQVRPGDVLDLEVTMTRLRSNLGVAKAVATVGGEVACTADLTFMFEK